MKDFRVLAEVGKGSYGRVFKVDLKGQVLALKQVSKDIVIKTGKIASIHFEKDVLQKAKTDFMPHFHFTFQVSITTQGSQARESNSCSRERYND